MTMLQNPRGFRRLTPGVQPQYSVRFNPAYKHKAGLKGAYIGPHFQNLLTGKTTVRNGGPFTEGVCPYGRYTYDPSGGVSNNLDTGDVHFSGAGDRTVFILTDQDTAKVGTFYDAGVNGTGTAWRFRAISGDLRIEITGSGYTWAGQSAVGAVGCVFSGTQLQHHRLFANGAFQQATGTNSVNTGSATHKIASVTSHVTAAGGPVALCLVWDRALSDEEMLEVYRDPYAFASPAIPMPVFTAAAATPNFDIPTTSYAVSLPTPTLTSQTAFSVPATSYTATLPAPNFTTATALDVPVTSYAVTLPAPSFTTVTALDVPAISYAETLPAPSFTTNTALDIPAISYTTTLPAPSFTTATVHSVPVISYTVTLPAITVSSVSTEAMQIMAGDWAVRTSAADWAVRRNEADWAVRIEAGDWKYDA